MFKAKSIDIVNAPLFSSILKYALPIMIGGLVQVLFNAADLAVLGNFSSTVVVAAAGATGPIVGLIVNSIVGLSGGTNVILARAVGAGDVMRSRRVVGTSVILSVTIGIIMTVVGIIFAPWLLEITSCDPSYIEDARLYLVIYFSGIPAILLYNFGSAIIRVSGDSRRPLYYIIAAGVLNIILNVLLCFVMTEKIAAVAIATVASQCMGAVLVVIHMVKITGPCRLDLKHISFSWRELGAIIKVGLPGAFNGALYNISNLQIQSAINSFGPAATAGNAASTQVEGLASSITNAFSVAALAFLGQNLGAGKQERVRKTFWMSLCMGFATGLVLGLGLFVAGRPLLDIFVPNDELASASIEFGLVRMRYILGAYCIAAANNVIGAAIQAFGYPSFPMINSIVTVLMFRVAWMTWIYPNLPVGTDPVSNISNLYSCYTWSWSLSIAVNAMIFAAIYVRYKRGRLKKV